MTTLIICQNPKCCKSFLKKNSEIKKSTTNRHFCSKSCSVTYFNSVSPKIKIKLWVCSVCGIKVSYQKTKCKIHKNPDFELHRTCTICSREYQFSRTAGHTSKLCNSCVSNRRRLGLKEKCIIYKGGKCEKCGYNKCLRSLAFHHKDPKTKNFNISGSHCRKWEEIKLELDKCEILCHNCHNETHDNLLKKERLVDSDGIEPS